MGGRTRSLDSLDVEGDEERPLPLKKKKHKTLEESSDPAKRSEKVKRKQIVEKESSDSKRQLIVAFPTNTGKQIVTNHRNSCAIIVLQDCHYAHTV